MRTDKKVLAWRRGLRPMVLLLLNILLLAFLSCSKAQAADPAVTITEFSDFQCPYCQQAAVVVEEVQQVYGSSVKCVFKQMPLPMHQCTFKAAEAALIAEHQGKFRKSHCVAGSRQQSVRLRRSTSNITTSSIQRTGRFADTTG